MSGLKIKSKWRHWVDFVLAMTEKEVKARYKSASLGFLWMLINPLLQMVVIGVIFQFFVPTKIDNYFAFLFAGLLPWNFFSYSLTKTTPSIVFERTLIQKAKFPREAIVLSIVLSNLFHFFISVLLFLCVLIFVFLIGGRVDFLFNLLERSLLLLPATIWLVLLCSGFCLLFSSLNVRFRDVNFAVQAMIPLWFYATPIVYTLNLLPSTIRMLVYLNPLTAITELFQWILVGTNPSSFAWWTVSICISFVVTLFGILIFNKESPTFDDWL